MQTSTTKRPDALKAQEYGLKVLECGGSFSAAKLSRAAAPKQNDWGGFKQAKVCLLAISCQQSKSGQNGCFAKMASDSYILYDFAYKNHRKWLVDHLKVVFLPPKTPH
jgi:hypothetical protein